MILSRVRLRMVLKLESRANDPTNPLTQKNLRPLNDPFTEYEDEGERRLYWTINHMRPYPGQPTVSRMKPNVVWEKAQAHKRMNRAKRVDPAFASRYDVFRTRHTFDQKGYSTQVEPAPLPQVFSSELSQTEGPPPEMGILLDISGSMGFDNHQDGFHQPCHIDVVQSILCRALPLLVTRDHYPEQGVQAINTFAFNTYGRFVGRLNPENFPREIQSIRNSVGGGTRVMTGWQEVKKHHFVKHGYGRPERATYDVYYGWQAKPDLPKLSLLVLLDGEADDMDEFELELLSETWCYVTILLIGREHCPHHHRHANELERIAQQNPHITFFDVQGRISERYVVYHMLNRICPAQPITMTEVLDPALDQPPPAYTPY